MAAKQKTRTTYDNILRVVTDLEVRDLIQFLRAGEIVHFQRFGETLERTKEQLDQKNYYYFNPEFDKQFGKQMKQNTLFQAGLCSTCKVLFYGML